MSQVVQRCFEATNPSFGKYDDVGLWLSVRSLSAVTCSEVSMERVLRVQMMRFAGWVGVGYHHREAVWR